MMMRHQTYAFTLGRSLFALFHELKFGYLKKKSWKKLNFGRTETLCLQTKYFGSPFAI